MILGKYDIFCTLMAVHYSRGALGELVISVLACLIE